MREILASLETVYHDPFPQLNLRQWSGAIYTRLTQPVLDPTRSGRVTMDYLMKLVTTALEWTYQARETDVKAETLQAAAELLVLRRDTLRIIDGAGPSIDAPQSESTATGYVSATEVERVSSPIERLENPTAPITERTDMANQAPSAQSKHVTSSNAMRGSAQPTKTAKCTFSGEVPIDLNRFLDSGIALVECLDCGRTWTLEPHRGVLRFKSHDKRKTRTLQTGQRWTRGKMDWDVVGEESSEMDF